MKPIAPIRDKSEPEIGRGPLWRSADQKQKGLALCWCLGRLVPRGIEFSFVLTCKGK